MNETSLVALHQTAPNTIDVRSRLDRAGLNGPALDKAAEEFEAMFLAQMLNPMFETLSTDGPFAGGHAEQVYRSMLVEQFGKSMARAGGIGIAPAVRAELLKLQEVH